MPLARSLDDLAQILREARRAQGLTQSELGDRAGVRAHHISNIENGVTNPTAATVLSLFAALELDWQVVPRATGARIEDIF
ncbi:helix-turn-helix transcriptional regulator [Paracoccus sp. CPCC 101403]|uniref:Helix-turn-helix transcriptional regulator n=1 Tax=Paracoccus broussonetiae TaxID=3075834 RepID=A0ABU3E928_9RHOB|nr:helix-turn-helix transcriptional regulator [Paracoccus sp. CPCC 101403]MDT1060722.1 helix-turn-helix transcriptional regulator [Paracoccus sp. CPCC 101403]